ncbi:MAG: hypothetical protein ACLQNG_17095 [Acidimicrobiales bacterium]|jgi:hypothetical protein
MAAGPIPRARPPGPSLRLSIPLLALGVVAAVVSIVGLANVLLHTISDATLMSTPGSEQVTLSSGTYVFYVEAGTASLAATPTSVDVTGPGGGSVPLQLQSTTETVARGGREFSGRLGFTASVAGDYTITIHTSGSTLVVAPAFTTIARDNLGWVIGLLVSLLAGLIGLVLLVVGLVQRSKAKKRAAQYGGGVWGGPPGPWPGPPGPPPGGRWQAPGGWPAQPAWGWQQGQQSWPPPTGQPAWPPPQQQPAWSPTPRSAPPPSDEPTEHSGPFDGPLPGWPRPSSKPSQPPQ